jgi:hypothetical protein
VIFVIATVAALASTPLLPRVTGEGYLADVAASAGQMAVGMGLLLVAAFTSATIAVAMYPVMRRWHEGLALASVVLRAMEGLMYIVAVAFLLSLLSVSQQFVAAPPVDQPIMQAIADTMRGAREHAALLGVFCFCLGAFCYYLLFFQSRLVPRWISGFGLIAIAMMFTACWLSLLSDSPITGYVFLLFPILVQEMVLAVWLIVKGFDVSALPSAAESA